MTQPWDGGHAQEGDAPLVDGIRSLTQDEASERSRLLTVQRYDIEVDLTDLPTGAEVRCQSTISFTARAGGLSTFVDCVADVLEGTLNGRPVPPALAGRIALDDLHSDNVLVVRTVQRDTSSSEAALRCVDPSDGEVYLTMSFQPDAARQVWACFDQPDLKAPHAITVLAPAAWTVVSNSAAESIHDVDDGKRVWRFGETPPLPTYDPVVLAGPWHEIRRESGNHDLGLFARRSLAPVLERDADELFDLTARGLDFFSRVFDLPFSQRKYDQVFVPGTAGAMENWGAVALTDELLPRSEPTPAESQLLARVILHEMAHMWFGNIVTLRWWDDLWLNESFAEFAANWVMVHATQHVDAWAVHLAYEKIRAYDTDQGPTSHPIRMPVPDVASAAATFDALTYSKGASSLQQLSAFLGEEDFRAGMATYFRRHAWGNTTLQDLVDELSAASGRDLDSWRQGWLETAGTDLIRLERTEDGFELVADGPGGAEPRPHVLDVAAYRRTTAGLERVACPRVELTGRRTRVELPPDADVYVPNDSDVTFARVRPEERTRDAFFELGGELTTPTARGIVAATAWDMLLNGEASTVETVGCITGILAHEPSPTIFEVMLDLAVTVAELWAPDAARPALQDGLAGVCRGLVGIPAMRQVALRGLARTVCGDEDLHWLEEQADGDVDLLWRVQARRAEVSGVLDEPALAALAAQDPDPDAGMRALGVRAALPDAATKAKVWDELVSGRVPVAYVYTLGKAFWRPGQDALLAPFAEKYLDRVPSLHRGGLLPAMVFTRWLFPVFGLNGDLVEWERALEADAAPVVRRVISERLDEVRRMVRARAS